MTAGLASIISVAAIAVLALWRALQWRRQRLTAEYQRDRLFELSPNPAAVTDFDGRFVQVNPAWTSVFGWTTAELHLRPLAEFVHTDDIGSSPKFMASLLAGKTLDRLDSRFRCRDGSYRLLSWSACPIVQERLIVLVGQTFRDTRHSEIAHVEGEQRLRRLIDGLGPQIFVGLLATDGSMLEVNRQALEVAGLAATDVMGKPVESTFWFAHSPETQNQMRASIERAAHGDASRFDMEIQVAQGRRLTIDFSLQPLRDDSGQIAYLVASASDVTERADAQRITRQALDGFQKVFRSAPEAMSVSEIDSGRFIQVNDAFCKLFGYSRDELIGSTSQDLNLWSTSGRRKALIEGLAEGKIIHGQVGRGRSHGGGLRDLLISAERMEFEGRPVLLLMLMDVTELHRAEVALAEANERLRQLSQRILDVQEEERAAVARELHDEIGQALTAIKLGVQWYLRRVPTPEQDRLHDCVALTDGALAQVRDLALELRPPQLDQLGLTAALRDLAHRLGSRAGLTVKFLSDQADIAPGFSLATTAFRVAQEALTNVVRHAGARTVTIELSMRSEELLVAVTDDGRSFDLEVAMARALRTGSMGLIGMRERVELAGGVLRIEARPGSGTRVEARFPVMRAANPTP